MARWMSCGLGELPLTYLGLPIGVCMRRTCAWNPVVEKLKKRLADWKAKTMSFVERLTLVKAVLGSLPLYYFSMFHVPSSVIKNLESIRRDFFGEGWGGGVWRDIIRVWAELAGLGLEFVSSFVGVVGNGNDIRFWVDKWVGGVRLCDKFLRLYHLDSSKEGKVAEKEKWVDNCWCRSGFCVRNLRGRVCKDFEELQELLLNVVIKFYCRDSWRWMLKENDDFTVIDLTKLVEEKTLSVDSLFVLEIQCLMSASDSVYASGLVSALGPSRIFSNVNIGSDRLVPCVTAVMVSSAGSHCCYVGPGTSEMDQFYAKDLWNVCNQYGNVVDDFIPNRRSKSGPQSQNVEGENKPTIVLGETCMNQQDYFTSLMGKVKEFDSSTDLKFSQLEQDLNLFSIDERVTWVDIEGIPLKVHAKEVFGWIPKFLEDDEEESDSDDEIREEELHKESASLHNHATAEGESDVEEVFETIFENEQYQAHKKDGLNVGQNDIRSEDPFNTYDILNKKQDNIIGGSSSDNMKYPPEFTPTVATEVQSNAVKKSEIEGDECLQNIHDDKVASEVKKTCPLSNSKDDREESIFYAPQELSKKKILWDYLTLVIDNWNGEVVIMGDFNEVQRTWNDAHVIDSNAMKKLMKKMKYLKEKIRAWIKVKKDSSKNIKKTLKAELAEIDLLLDKGEGNYDVLNKCIFDSKSLLELDKLE
ncbi:hypothetical protein Tco_0411871 [Tanacetum coccineum]